MRASIMGATPAGRIGELGGIDEAVQDGGALTATVGTPEQVRFAPEGDAAVRTIGSVVGEADPPVIEETGLHVPAANHAAAGRGRDCARAGQAAPQQCVEFVHQRYTVALPNGKSLPD